MRWVAPTEKDEANHQLEKRLWAAANQFGANSAFNGRRAQPPFFLAAPFAAPAQATTLASAGKYSLP